MIHRIGRRLAAFAVAFAAATAFAQGYPSKPITLIVPFAAGGPTDTIARMLAERMSRTLGQTMVVENVAGAGGTIANNKVLHAPADGYMIEIGHVGTHVLAPAVQDIKTNYVAEFEPIAMVAANAEIVVVNPSVPVKTLQEFVDHVKKNPGGVSYGTGGPGTPSHVMAVDFGNRIGAPLNIVHYKGSGPALQDVIAGHVSSTFDQAATALGQVKAGRVRALAVTAKTRLASAPEIPTVDEAGMPGFYMSIWHALWAPKGTPKEVVAKLNAAAREALADPVVKKKLEDIGQEIPPADQQNPEALRAHHKAETDKWFPVIRQANIKAQ
jgi:tripartite-type tricarboxylate transporter receptor subunit TctC